MGTKRPHHDDSTPPEPPPQRNTNHPFKRRKPNDFTPPTTKPPSINQLKSKIRDLTRALEHSDHLPAGVRIEKERALAGYKQDVEQIHNDKRKNELIKKYHMVRFFERQKATRAHKKLKKHLDASSSSPPTSERNQLENDVHDAEIDLNYTIYHPLTEKYQSIFPRQQNAAGGETASRKLVREKPAMWHVVERCAAEGTLEALRDGKVAIGIPGGKLTPAMEKDGEKREGKSGSKAAKSAALLERDGDSDGGFFEE